MIVTLPGEPVTLLADQIAGSMTGLLRGWIAGPAAATPSRITGMLWSGARALVSADAAAPH